MINIDLRRRPAPHAVLPSQKTAKPATSRLKGFDIMDTQALVIIIVLVVLLGGGGWYGRGRWF